MVRNGIHKQRRLIVGGLKAVLVLAGVVGASGPAIGTAKDETSQQTGQQSLGVRGGESSQVINGWPRTNSRNHRPDTWGRVRDSQERSQYVRLHVTKDTNKVCSDGASVPTSQRPGEG